MARHSDHDEIAAHALRVCEDMRDPDVGPLFLYQELAGQCREDPERMAQLIMCLAAWAPYEEPISSLTARTWAIAEQRVLAWGPRAS
jgi:hypothetical protein